MSQIMFLFKRIWIKILTWLNTIANRSQVTCDNTVTFAYKARIFNIRKDPKRIVISANTFINGELTIYKHGGCITVGEYCFIGEGTRIWSGKKITIGNRVLISHNVSIHDSNDHPIDAKDRHVHFKAILHVGHPDNISFNEKEVIIEDDVWLGFSSIILKGVTIGKGAIVGAGSVVTKSVPPYTVVAGNPAIVVKSLQPSGDTQLNK